MSGEDSGGSVYPPPTRIRPGPDAVPPASAPGGIVLHVYDRANRLLLERPLPASIGVEVLIATAERDADAVIARVRYAGDIVVVVFDGDSGARIRPPFETFDDAAELLAAPPPQRRVFPGDETICDPR